MQLASQDQNDNNPNPVLQDLRPARTSATDHLPSPEAGLAFEIVEMLAAEGPAGSRKSVED